MTAAKNNDELFTPSARPRPSLATILLTVFGTLLVAGGFYVMSLAFETPDETHATLIFSAGLAMDVVAFWVMFGLVPAREGAALK